jgi:hypothetical protein
MLENFKKKIYLVGVIDDLTTQTETDGKETKSPEKKLEIANNVALIRDLVKDIKPENVLLELC